MDYNPKEELKMHYSLWRETSILYESWAKLFDLSYYELFVLYSLWENTENQTQKQICEQWVLPKQTVSSILKDFEKHGFILYKPVETDKRNKAIILTKSGQEFTKKIITSLQSVETCIFQRLGEERAKTFLEITALCNKYFKQELEVIKNDKTVF